MAKAPTRAARSAQADQPVKALVPVNYDETRYEAGETFAVRAEDLDQLLEVNAVEVVESTDAPAA